MRDEFEQIHYFKNQLLYDGVNPSEKVDASNKFWFENQKIEAISVQMNLRNMDVPNQALNFSTFV